MAFQNRFEGQPLLCWTIDDFEQLDEAVKSQAPPNFNLNDYVRDYAQSSYDGKISLLFESAPFKLNLGGETEKSKLVATEKSIGVFDFSLASKGLYKLPEYYSGQLAIDFPEKFKDYELPSGVVPANLVKQREVFGEREFYYEDSDGVFVCEIRQKGQTAVDDGLEGAKLKFATRSKKVFLTYKRNKGKVKYVEIYSLFYYTNLVGDLQYAIRHIPAIMIADYLEKMGVMTRIYMTRFVQLDDNKTLRATTDKGVNLPLYDLAPQKTNGYNLFVQPIIAKEFGQEIDKPLAFMISSQDFNDVYDYVANYALRQEVTRGFAIYGNPDWSQNDYFEGLERYRNKYKEYVKLGIFKSKEVLPEAMIFFHDIAIRNYINIFLREMSLFIRDKKNIPNLDSSQVLVDIDVYPFFNLWMKISANNIKNKIEIINSNELRKDLIQMNKDLVILYEEFQALVKINRDKGGIYIKLGDLIENIGQDILSTYDIISRRNKNYTFKNYVINITNEITTFSEGLFFPTQEERVEYREKLVESVLNELQYI
jgi:hypothetical protein